MVEKILELVAFSEIVISSNLRGFVLEVLCCFAIFKQEKDQ
jgi:hypothetical protein